MIVALTGTPGTGKTSVAEQFEEFNVIDLTEFVKARELGEQKEEFEVDIERMEEELEKEIDRGKDVVVEGHLSHHIQADYCIVLRCEPGELRERLSERDYPEEKVEENVEAEILDTLLIEAVEEQQNIIEVDTTSKSAEKVAEEVRERMKNDETGYGEIDWTENIV